MARMIRFMVAVALTLTLAACGGDDDSTRRDQIAMLERERDEATAARMAAESQITESQAKVEQLESEITMLMGRADISPEDLSVLRSEVEALRNRIAVLEIERDEAIRAKMDTEDKLAALLAGAAPWPVVLPPDAWTHEDVSEGTILAVRLLSGEGAGLSFDGEALDMLADEIEAVLTLVRTAYPETAEIVARWPDYAWGRLLLTLSHDLTETVERLVKGQTEPVELRTGNEAFDRLNAELGVEAVVSVLSRQSYSHLDLSHGYVEFEYGRTLNLAAAAERYAGIEGVSQADLVYLVGDDGPNVHVERQGTGWVVSVVDAWGACPTGCIYRQETRFLVKDGMVHVLESRNG